MDCGWTKGLVGSFVVAILVLFTGISGCKKKSKSKVPTCEIDETSTDFEEVETRCDGIDNDCDFIADMLQPTTENECRTGKKGLCKDGYYGCLRGEKVCFAPPPTPEVFDNLDNDCNGVVDDVPPAVETPLRARVMVPPYIWTDGPGVVDQVTVVMDQLGIPYDADTNEADWTAGFESLDDYSLVVMPGYIIGNIFTEPQIQALTNFVTSGGVLVWFALLTYASPDELNALAGLRNGKSLMNAMTVVLNPVTAGFWLDSPEEREQKITDDPEGTPVEVFTYRAQSDTDSFGVALDKTGTNLGPTFFRRPVGSGAVYTMGHNLGVFGGSRCYVNCFDPGYDLLGLFLKGTFQEATDGHFAVKHTVPGVESSVLVISHDIDAPDSHLYSEHWGEPGAIQMLRMEQEKGVKSTNYITTDYYTGYYNPGMVSMLCDMDNCPEGGHSVLHSFLMDMPRGDCNVTYDTYNPSNPTVCGEIRVCMELLYDILPRGYTMYSWRTPFLTTHEDQWEILYDEGVLFDASLGLGDLRSNYPVYLKTFPLFQRWFRGLPMFEYVMTIEDGFGSLNPDGTTSREEMRDYNLPKFLSTWAYAMRQNERNNAWTVLLVHPSMGFGVGPENLQVKIDSVAFAIDFAQDSDILIEQVTPLGFFSLGRETARIEAHYGPDGYTGTIQTGSNKAPNFSLEFGDHIRRFDAPGAPAVQIRDNRVVFREPLRANNTYTFSAEVN